MVMLDAAAKKTVLRQFSYGLYAITAAHAGERGVFTANWLSQVSFDPPLVVLSVERESSTLGLIRQSSQFAICPLATEQRELAGALGKPHRRAGDKFATLGLATIDTESGVPVLADALGFVVCRVLQEIDAGDSVLLLGEPIEAAAFREDPPLTMREAGFRHAG